MFLALFIPPEAESFGPDTICEWALLDASGAPLRSGSDPLHALPRLRGAWVVLPANRVLFTQMALPPVSAARLAELLPFAVEDKLMSDPGTIHAVVAPRARAGAGLARGDSIIAVVDKPWLSRVLGALATQGIVPGSVVPESELFPRAPGEWNIVLPAAAAGAAFLVRDDGLGVAFDYDAAHGVPFSVQLALKEAAAAPARLRVYGGDAALDAQAWSAALGVPVERTALPSPEQRAAALLRSGAGQRIDLLTGSLAARYAQRTGWRELARAARPALWMAGALVAVHVAFVTLDWWRLDRERASLDAQMTAAFKDAFPEARAIVDPALQMRRNLDTLRRERGLSDDSDFMVLAGRAARAIEGSGARTRAVQFSGRRLALDIEADSPAALQAVATRAATQSAQLGAMQQGGPKPQARLTLELAP